MLNCTKYNDIANSMFMSIIPKVPAATLSSDITKSQEDVIYTKLYFRKPEIVMLYVTPEKVSSKNRKDCNK